MSYLKVFLITLWFFYSPITLAKQLLEPQDSIGLGVEKQVPLSRNFEFDGLVITGQKSVFEDFLVTAKLGYYQESVGDSDFTLQTQRLLIGYRYRYNNHIDFNLYVGFLREELEHDAVDYNNTDSDSSAFYQGAIFYQLNTSHQLALKISFQSVYDADRYNAYLVYRYNINRHWQLSSQLTMGYSSNVEHDLNAYQLMLEYKF